MGAPINIKKQMMAMKIQSARATALAASAFEDADADIRFRDITVSPDIEFAELQYATGNHDKATSQVGKMKCAITASVDIRYSGVAGTAPKITKALKACGLTETATTSVTWTPLKAGDLGPGGMPYTILVYNEVIGATPDAFATRVSCALGNVKFVGDDQRIFRADFEFTGIFDGFEDIANADLLTLTGFDTALAQNTKGVVCSVASTDQRINTFEIDAGNVVEIETGGVASGFTAAYIADRKPMLKINPLVDLLATDPHWTRFAAQTESVATLTLDNYTFAAQKAQLQPLAIAAQDNAMAWDQTYQLNEDTSNGYPWILTHAA